jgi:hypothetical protein
MHVFHVQILNRKAKLGFRAARDGPKIVGRTGKHFSSPLLGMGRQSARQHYKRHEKDAA